MFDIGWQELLVIAVVALIVIGPKDLPRALKAITHWIGKLRGLAYDFQRGLDDVVREAELDDIKKKLTEAPIDVQRQIENTIDPTGDIQKSLDLTQVQQDLDRKAREMAEGSLPTPDAPPALSAPSDGTSAPPSDGTSASPSDGTSASPSSATEAPPPSPTKSGGNP